MALPLTPTCHSSNFFSFQYECGYYVTLTDDSTKLMPKGPENCTRYISFSLIPASIGRIKTNAIVCLPCIGNSARLGPITSGFNEAACDIFHGTW